MMPQNYSQLEIIVTWTATDSAGNPASATQTVSVVDTSAPKLYLPSAITAEATAPFGNVIEYGSATASDEVAVASISNDAPSTFSLGETIVTWMATDSSGNLANAAQRIIIVDTTPPELVLPDNVIVDSIGMNTIVSVGQANSTDLTDHSPIITNDAPEMFSLGETIVTWTAIDIFGNSVNATQKIEVQACGKPLSYYNMIEGSFDDDIMVGTNLPDLIFAYGGDDIIMGEKGNDCIFGGEGDDIIFGNEGNDNLSGGEGNDIIKGQAGSDIITSGTGMDLIDGGDDNDTCIDAENSDGDLVAKCEL